MAKRGSAHEQFLRKVERMREREAKVKENLKNRQKNKRRKIYVKLVEEGKLKERKTPRGMRTLPMFGSNDGEAWRFSREALQRRQREGRGRTLASSLRPNEVDLTLRWYRCEVDSSTLVRVYGTRSKGVLRCARALRDLVRDGYLELDHVGLFDVREERVYRWFRGEEADGVLQIEFFVESITKSILRASAILLELLDARRVKLRTTPELEKKFFDTEWVDLPEK